MVEYGFTTPRLEWNLHPHHADSRRVSRETERTARVRQELARSRDVRLRVRSVAS
jgi:hypothetical protein